MSREGWSDFSMMSIKIVAVGRPGEDWIVKAGEEYIKRLTAFCRIKTLEVAPVNTAKNAGEAQIRAAVRSEGTQILKNARGGKIIALCIEGEAASSKQLAEKIQSFAVSGQSSLTFCIGGSNGLSQEVKDAAVWKLSMSKMTFPHQLARLMLLEQIYRAFSIAANMPYHK
jgi:23S rRNA (pseudouridine1915-N3)-methyltransferase